MNTSCFCQLLIAPGIPAELQRLSEQFNAQYQHLLTDATAYMILAAGLALILFLVAGSLLIVQHSRSLAAIKLLTAQPLTSRRARLPVRTRIGRTNQTQLRFLSAQLRAGRLNN